MTNAVSKADSDALQTLADQIRELDGEVANGVQTVLHNAAQVGTLIQDAKALCPPDHWEAWLKQRAKLSVSRAAGYVYALQRAKAQTLQGAVTADRLLELLEPEAGELDRLAAELRAVGADEPEPASEPSEPSDEPEAPNQPETPVDASSGDDSEPSKPQGAKPPLKVEATRVKPAEAVSIGDRIREGRGMYQVLVGQVHKLGKAVDALAATEYGTFMPKTELDGHLQNAQRCLRFAKPFKPCCYCKTKDGERRGCRTCKKQRWITEAVWKNAPENLRKDADEEKP